MQGRRRKRKREQRGKGKKRKTERGKEAHNETTLWVQISRLSLEGLPNSIQIPSYLNSTRKDNHPPSSGMTLCPLSPPRSIALLAWLADVRLK
jgi:hypothetical protein